MGGEEIVYPALWAAVALHSLLVFRAVWGLANTPAVRKLDPVCIIACLASLSLCFFTFSLFALLPWAQWGVFLVVSFAAVGVLIGVVGFTFLRLYVQFFLTEQKLELAGTLVGSQTPATRLSFIGEGFLDSFVQSRRNLLVMAIASGLFFTLPLNITGYIIWKDFYFNSLRQIEFPRNATIGGGRFSALVLWILVQVTFVAILFLWMYSKMRKRRIDRWTTAVVGYASICAAYIALSSLTYASPRFYEVSLRHFDYKSLVIWFVSNEIMLISVSWECYKISSAIKTTSQGNVENLKLKMKTVLENIDGNKLFVEKARDDFCIENVLFWNAVRLWKQKSSSLELKVSIAKKIVDLHILVNSPTEINISFECRSAILDALGKLDQDISDIPDDIFDEAISQVESFLFSQVFFRVRKCSEYNRIIASADL